LCPNRDRRFDPTRRKFLVDTCEAGAAACIPGLFRSATLPWLPFLDQAEGSQTTEYQFHPKYRATRPIDDLLLKVNPGLDQFITEKYAAEIEAILTNWTETLLRSAQDVQPLGMALADEFIGCALDSKSSAVVRSDRIVEIKKNQFSAGRSLPREPFLDSAKRYLQEFTKLQTVRFQIVDITKSEDARGGLHTRIRYEFVGEGSNFYREQRVGYWELDWIGVPTSYRIQKWQSGEELQSRTKSRVFEDITLTAFHEASSYSQQLAHGADYWRTVLDGASGIDIYGHNGVSVGDIDNDGHDDLYVCQAAGLPNRLYRNRGDGTFEDITQSAGVGVLENTACALFADLRNSGRQDLIVVRTNGPLLFLNDGNGKFRQQPKAFEFAQSPQGTFTGAALADYDRDGFLDIYFCLYLYYQGTDQYKYPSPYYDAQNGPPNFLMRNTGGGTFVDVTKQAGMDKNNTRYSFCCAWNDYNQDGWPDLYVVNDFGRKSLYRNNGDGTFTDVAAEVRVDDVGAGMSVAWADFDNDGLDDLYVANMWTAAGERVSAQAMFQKDVSEDVRAHYRKHAMGNSLFLNSGAEKAPIFRDATSPSRTGNGGWSWSSDAWDFDHDGHLDLYVMNGMVSGPAHTDLNSFFWRQVVANSPNAPGPAEQYEQGWNAINELLRSDGTWSGYERNVCFLNNGDGTFSDVSGALGVDFVEDGRAFALADFDGDGRQELLLKNRNAPQLRLLKNVISELPASVSFRLHGVKSNRDAIGAAVLIETDIGKQTRTVRAGSGFLSQHSKEVFFGLGPAQEILRAMVHWPSGQVQELKQVPIDHRIIVEEGSGSLRVEPYRQRALDSHSSIVQPAEKLPSEWEAWLLAPFAAPDFSLPDLKGQMRTLSASRGKPMLLNFWALKSRECEKNLVQFQVNQSEWAKGGLQLLAVNFDAATAKNDVVAFARARGLSFPMLLGSNDVGAVYNIIYRYLFDRHRDLPLPTSLLIDPSGNIVKVYQGIVDFERLRVDAGAIPKSAVERQRKALPFEGISEAADFRRNYLSVGSVFFQREYYAEAAEAFQQALRENNLSAEALYGLGSVYLKQGKNDEARSAFERATRSQPDYPDTLTNAWNNLGLIDAREGRTEQAIADFHVALRMSPNHAIARNNLGNAYRQAKQWDDAQRTFQQVLTTNPSDADANYGLAMVFAQQDDTNQAYEHLKKALDAHPIFPEALNNLGILYLRTSRRDEAVSTFEQCIRVAPAFDQAYLNLARVYAIEGAREKARAVLMELLAQHPENLQAQKALESLGH
jgi:tetratricopeptide (TPR) repeat protein